LLKIKKGCVGERGKERILLLTEMISDKIKTLQTLLWLVATDGRFCGFCIGRAEGHCFSAGEKESEKMQANIKQY